MPTPPPNGPLCTRDSLTAELRALGVVPGETVRGAGNCASGHGGGAGR
ncbi:hypothetical protein [Streptomyces sp. HNM0574]|nr:hypothetical protein [Streptomyces sp. HNM0574]NLU67073.1 hypothetical protein [Streptomyces sp. HNM0574]